MQIRRQSDPEFDAVRYSGGLDSLFTWLANQTDYTYAVVDKVLAVTVSKANGTSFILSVGDYVRIKEDNTLDKISATSFAANWEVVPQT